MTPRIICFLFFVLSFSSYAQTPGSSNDNIQPATAEERVFNFTSFTKLFQAPSAQEVALNKSTPGHPDLGFQYRQRPQGGNVVEIISKRTESSKFFKDADTVGKIFTQSTSGPVHYKKNGEWLTYDVRLQQKSAGVYEAYKQAEPVGFETGTASSFIKTLTAGKISFNNWTLYGVNNSGEKILIAKANWSNYTAGDDGMRVINIFDGIDAEMVLMRGSIKTNFVVNRSAAQWSGFAQLIFSDDMKGGQGLQWQFEDNGQQGDAIGNAVLLQNGKTILTAKEAIMYAPQQTGLFCGLKYRFQQQSLQMIIPTDTLLLMVASGKAIIDPLITGTTSTIFFSNSGRFGACTPNTPNCTYGNTVMVPGGTYITNAIFHWPGWGTVAPYNHYSAEHHFSVGCLSRYVVTLGTPNSTYTGGYTNPGTIGFGGDPCITGQCATTYVPWNTWLERSCTFPNATAGTAPYAGCNSNWVFTIGDQISTLTLEGRTFEYGSPVPITVTPSTTVCQGQALNISTYERYGVPTYNNQWSYSPTFNPLISNASFFSTTFNTPGTVRIYHRATDQCGAPLSSFVDIIVRAAPPLNLFANNPVCQGQVLNLSSTATGFTHAWTGPAGFTSALQNPTVNNMQAVNAGTYRVTATGNGCSMSALIPVIVSPQVIAEASASPLSLCEGQTLQLTSGFRANDIRITEVVMNAAGIGRTNPYPNFIPPALRNSADDFIEISNISSTPMAVGGLRVEVWRNATRLINYTIPTGEILPANSVFVLHLGAGVNNPAEHYYNTNLGNSPFASGDPCGIILKNNDFVVDVVAVNTSTWAAATGVTAADWSGATLNASGRAGVIRTSPTDNNLASDWEVANTPAPLQTLGSYNPVTFIPSPVPAILPFTYTWTGPDGFTSGTQSPTIPAITAAGSGIYSVSVISNGCATIYNTQAVVVAPGPSLLQPADQTECNGNPVTATTFTPTIAGTTFTWTNSNPAIGLAASGAGNVPSFIGVNTGNVPVVATITVAPSAGTCPSVPRTYTITINPQPVVNVVSNQQLCSGSNTNQIQFSSNIAGSTFSWVNDNPSIGLAVSGTGNIAAFTAVNNSAVTAVANITVTLIPPVGSCPGSTANFSISVYPTPLVTPPANQSVCNGAPVSAILFTGNIATANYNWTNDHPEIGLAASGTGDIPSFNAVNTGTIPITATITVTPATIDCPGPPQQFTITVNPSPVVNVVSDQFVCTGGPVTAINFGGSPAGTVYNWTNNTPSIGLAASGAGNIAGFNAVNTGTAPVTATITVTPVFTNGPLVCTGLPKQFSITVNPAATVNVISNQTICNNSSSSAISFSGPVPGSNFSWTNNNTSIGLAASGTGNIPAFTAINSTNAPLTATITVTPSATGCPGITRQFTITVNPTPAVNAVSNLSACNGFPVGAVNLSGNVTGTIYNWTNNTPAIGLPSGGTGNIPSFIGRNTGTAPVITTITVTPVYTNGATTCSGTSKTFTITINNSPKLGTDKSVKICTGATADLSGVFSATGLSGVWTNNAGTVITPNAVTAGTYRLVASNATSCSDTAFVMVQEYADINLQVFSTAATTIIEGQTVQLTSTGTGTLTYNWSPAAGLSLPQSATTIAAPPVTTRYVLTATNEGNCKDTAGIRIVVLPLDIIPSGAFTPNGDGYTDLWIIKDLQYARSSKVAVFNRWGNKVFEAVNYQNNWDGRYNGKPLPDGAYYYQVQVITANGRTINKSGSITLIR